MDQWIELRRSIRNNGVSLRQLERDTGLHRQTLRKIRDSGTGKTHLATALGFAASR